jgi:hypothetical protein
MPKVRKSKKSGMTRREYALHRGISSRAVDKALQLGRIPKTEGKIDPVVADEAWQKNTHPTKGRPRAKAGPGAKSYIDHKTQHEKYAALKAKAEYEALIGRQVDGPGVEAAAFQAARTARDALYNLPDRLADQLASTSDAHECHQMLRKEIDDVCALIVRTPILAQRPKPASGKVTPARKSSRKRKAPDARLRPSR